MIVAGAPTVFVSEKEAGVATPTIEAVRLYAPATEFAVPVTLAMPEAFVTAVSALNTTEAPVAGGAKVTVTPESGSPSVSVTSAAKAAPNAVLITVLWGLPDDIVTEVAGPVNLAVTLVVPAIVMLQEPVPVHAPDQPAKVQPAAGVSLRMTAEPSRNVELAVAQLVPHTIAAGIEVTVPPCAVFFVRFSVSAVPIESVSPAELFVVIGSVIAAGGAIDVVFVTDPVPLPAMTAVVSV